MDDISSLRRRPFTGIQVVAGEGIEIVAEILRRARDTRRSGCHIHLLEMNGVAIAKHSPDFRATLVSAFMVIPDGKWLEFFTRWSFLPLLQLRGEDLFRAIAAGDGSDAVPMFFLGADSKVLEELDAVLRREFPLARNVGMYSLPFRDMTPRETSSIARRISASGARIVWVGISTPKQDLLAAQLSHMTNAVIIPVGAAFDFVSGRRRSAPIFVRNLGLEWAFRLCSEPRRLWRRYVIGGFTFLSQIFLYRSIDRREFFAGIKTQENLKD